MIADFCSIKQKTTKKNNKKGLFGYLVFAETLSIKWLIGVIFVLIGFYDIKSNNTQTLNDQTKQSNDAKNKKLK